LSPLSTKEVARIVGIGHRTLERWLTQGRVAPKTVVIGRKAYRLWTEDEIEMLRGVKEKTYRKGRGRKSKKRFLR
jgi:DNA-binding transcriptional MerR regulator